MEDNDLAEENDKSENAADSVVAECLAGPGDVQMQASKRVAEAAKKKIVPVNRRWRKSGERTKVRPPQTGSERGS